MKAKVIAIVNQKGGVGKTFTAEHLGIGFARKGKKVLLIDADQQGSLTVSLGFKRNKLDFTLVDVFKNILKEVEFDSLHGILQHKEDIYLMPANNELASMEISLAGVTAREYFLKEYIESLGDQFDCILIDCPPSLGLMTINALTAANQVLIPTEAQFLAVDGMTLLFQNIARIKKKLNPSLEILGVLPTIVTAQTNNAKDILEVIRQNYGKHIKIFDPIPKSVRAEEVSSMGMSIYEYNPKGKVTAAYTALAEEVLQNE